MPKLEIHKGSQFLREHVFPDSDILVVGRAQSNDIVLPDSSRRVSRFHAAIVRLQGDERQYFIRDLGSLHCTRVCGVPVYQQVLSEGDVIEIASYRLVYSTRAQAHPRLHHLRVVLKNPDEAFPDSSTVSFDPIGAREAAHLSAEKRELLEQVRHKARRGLQIADFAEDVVTAVLRVVHADRGFIGLFREGHPALYHEVGLVNLAPEEAIEISDAAFAEHLMQGKPVPEGSTLLVPFWAGDGDAVSGFFCINRCDDATPFCPEDVNFLVLLGKLAPSRSDSERAGKQEAVEPIEWPVEIVGRSKDSTELFEAIRKAASIDMNVLILGETGAGKELVARAIHRHSSHAKGPFLARNCSQVPETLAESEIFGYAPKSGISGADPKGAKGWFEAADKGTLFLDEIHRLNHSMQDKFLRVLQDKVVSRIGSQAPIQVDVRILAATDQDMQKAVREGAVREPFYFRFGMQVHVPPLRQRKEDIPLLAYHFLDKYARKSGSRTRAISHRALRELLEYEWPGNVRQLEYAIKAGVAKNQEILFSWDFEDQLRHAIRRAPAEPLPDETAAGVPQPKPPGALGLPKSMEDLEKEKIKEALEVTQGNATRAAELLGYKSRQTILNKMDRYGIPRNYADPQAIGAKV